MFQNIVKSRKSSQFSQNSVVADGILAIPVDALYKSTYTILYFTVHLSPGIIGMVTLFTWVALSKQSSTQATLAAPQ